MKSVRSVFKIGIGPSSSHTMGPNFAAKQFFANNKDADSFKAILYGSLSKTGKGHGTDRAIIGAFYPRQVEIIFNSSETNLPHPNTMKFFAYKNGEEIYVDVPAKIENDRTLVPLRVVSESLNCRVDWDGENRIVNIVTK